MGQNVSMDCFYKAVGESISHWTSVEEELRQTLSFAIYAGKSTGVDEHVSDLKIAGIIFYSSSNLRWSLDLIAKILRHRRTSEDLLCQWQKLENAIRRNYKRRNVLAHGSVYGNDFGAVSIMVNDGWYTGSFRYLNYEQVLASTAGFKTVTQKVREFNQVIQEHLTFNLGD